MTTDLNTLETLMKDIGARMEALGTAPNEGVVRGWIQDALNNLVNDQAFARKMRFGGGSEQKLQGTKYARWGLSVADIEFLFDLQESLRGQRRVNGGVHEGASEELRNTFKAISDAVYMPMEEVQRMDKRALDDLFPRVPLSSFHGKDRSLAARGAWELTEAYQRSMRAMDTAETGYGLQLIGAQYVGDLWDAARRESRIFGLLDTFEMTAPTAYIPVEADLPEMLFVAESTSAGASAYTTSKTGSNRVTVTAKKFVIHQNWSGEMEEDSIIPFIPYLRRQAELSLAHYSDSVVINGDDTNAGTGNINLDDADPADTKHYLAFEAMRHVGLVDNTGNSKDLAGAISLAALMDVKGRMLDATYLMDWGHPTDPNDLVYVVDPATGDKIVMLDEVINQRNYRQEALLNGEVGRIIGHPVISSIAMSKTEADGKVSTTAGNNTKGQVLTFNRRGFKVGWRRRVRLESERIPGSDQTRMIYSLRLGFGRYSPTGADAGIECADVIYDISL